MEDVNQIRKIMKEAMKGQLKTTISSSWDKHIKDVLAMVEQATDAIAQRVLDEAKIEEIAKSARAGATYVAVSEMLKKVADEATQQAAPAIKQFSDAFTTLLKEAASEAIQELLAEKLKDMDTST